MALTPVEVRHIQLKRGLFGYRKGAVHRMMDDIADSFETVWRERSQLVERVEELETEVSRHVELEGLLRSTLVSAERASQDIKDAARRDATVIVNEANAEARKVMRDAITEKEQLMGDVRRVQALLRSALAVVDEVPDARAEQTAPEPAEQEQKSTEDTPGWPATARTAQAAPVVLPSPQEEPEEDPQARRLGARPASYTTILGAWSPARSVSTSGSRPGPDARRSSAATVMPGSSASRQRRNAGGPTRR